MIQKELETQLENKTIIQTAHQLKDIERADQIIVFEQGKVVASGTHEQLMRDCITYQSLIQVEQGGVV